MGADLMICLDCGAKQQLGAGLIEAGSQRLLQLKKTRNQVRAIMAHIGKEEPNPLDVTIKMVVNLPDGPVERDTRIGDMLDSTKPLDELAHHCQRCPANALDESFGCWGYVSYPIERRAEEWLMARVQPARTFGGWLLLKAIDDFGYDGAPLVEWRRRGLLEAERGITAIVKRGLFSKETVSSDQILQAVFCVGHMHPLHCLLVLLWLGAVEIDGAVPADAKDPSALERLTILQGVAERSAVARLNIGPPSDDPAIAAMQRLLTALYRAWLVDAPLHVNS